MDRGRSGELVGRLRCFGAFGRLIGVIAVGVALVAVYLVFPFSDHQNVAVRVLRGGGCRFTALYNLGDSNSDTGSVSATFGRVQPPNGRTFFGKPSGRLSDGRLLIDFIAEKLGFPHLPAYLDFVASDFMHGANFAANGATIQNLDTKLCTAGFNPLTLHVQLSQIKQLKERSGESYARGKSYPSKILLPKPESFLRALFTLDIGQNDLHAGLNSLTEEQVKATIPQIIDHFSVAVEKLFHLGARAFWIHNTGPIGCLPYFVVQHPPEPNNTDPCGCIKSYNELAQEFNKQLREKIAMLQSELQEALLVYVDIYSAKYSLIREGKSEGFSNSLGYCCGRLGVAFCSERAMVNGTEVSGHACSNPSEFISWDGVHYTEAANKWLANHILGGDFSEPAVALTDACHHPS